MQVLTTPGATPSQPGHYSQPHQDESTLLRPCNCCGLSPVWAAISTGLALVVGRMVLSSPSSRIRASRRKTRTAPLPASVSLLND